MTDLERMLLALYRIRDAKEPPRDPIELVEALIAEIQTFGNAERYLTTGHRAND